MKLGINMAEKLVEEHGNLRDIPKQPRSLRPRFKAQHRSLQG